MNRILSIAKDYNSKSHIYKTIMKHYYLMYTKKNLDQF